MNFKDDLLYELRDYHVWKIDVDREISVKGQPAIRVIVYTTTHNPHEFTFAKANKMTSEHMIAVIKSYLAHRLETAV